MMMMNITFKKRNIRRTSPFFLAVALLVCISANSGFAVEYAITIDDPNLYIRPLMSPLQRDNAILKQLRSVGIQAALFVCGMRVDSDSGKKLLKRWDGNGHLIANHTYSHRNYNSSSVAYNEEIADILKTEPLLDHLTNFQKIFRFPFLKSGNNIVKRDSIRQFLKKNRYRYGYVTVDASDWYVSSRLEKKLENDPNANISGYRSFYLKHMWKRAQYYDDLVRKVIGRSPKHTILIHHNLLNALFLEDLVKFFRSKGWKPVDANDAFKDPIFNMEVGIIPSGEAITWALAKEAGVSGLRYPAEDGSYEKTEMDKLGL